MKWSVTATALVVASVSLIQCVESQRFEPIPEPHKRLEAPAFSLLPPQGSNWVQPSAEFSPHTRTFFKETGDRAHTIAASARILLAPPDRGAGAQLLERELQLKRESFSAGRHQLKHFDGHPESGADSACARYDLRAVDLGVPDHKGQPFDFDVHGRLCLHPDFPQLFVEIEYSQRIPPGAKFIDLGVEGEGFLASLKLTPLGARITAQQVGESVYVYGLAASSDAVWLADQATNIVYRIDAVTNAVTDRIPVAARPIAIASDDGAVWVSNSDRQLVTRIDSRTRKVVAEIPVGTTPSVLCVGGGAVWVANSDDGTITQIDPGTNKIVGVLEANTETAKLGIQGMTFAAGSLWVTGNATKGVTWMGALLLRIDPQSKQHIARVALPPLLFGVVGDDKAVWVNRKDGMLYRVDPENNKVATEIRVSKGPAGMAMLDGVLWIANYDANTLTRVDPVGNRTIGQPIPIGYHPMMIAVVGHSLWVTAHFRDKVESGALVRVAPLPADGARQLAPQK